MLLLGEELHYGLFTDSPDEDLATATARLTRAVIDAAEIEAGIDILDVGCGVGAPACQLAREFGAHVTGITTSEAGVRAARARAVTERLDGLVSFEQRDGTANGFPDETFDRVWVLESSHLMRARDRLVAECARVLRPSGRLALCDIVLKRPMDLLEVRRLRKQLALLRDVFGDARMEPVEEYRRLASASGLKVDGVLDLTAQTRPTFAAWRTNARIHRERVIDLLGLEDWQRFVAACDVLERFWDEGILGYALFSAAKP
jgi:27-O-demethylrifamycin SV methyltransferase